MDREATGNETGATPEPYQAYWPGQQTTSEGYDPYTGYYQQPYSYEQPEQQAGQQAGYDPLGVPAQADYQSQNGEYQQSPWAPQPGYDEASVYQQQAQDPAQQAAYAAYADPAAQNVTDQNLTAQQQTGYEYAALYWPAPDGTAVDPATGYPSWTDPYADQAQAQGQAQSPAPDTTPYPVDFPAAPGTDPAAADAPSTSSAATETSNGNTTDESSAPKAPTTPSGLVPRLVAAATGRGSGTDRRTFLTRAAVGVVALTVVVVVGAVVAGHGADKGPKQSSGTAASGPKQTADLGTAHVKAWAAPADAADGSSAPDDGLLGAWITGQTVVRGDGQGVTAYSLTDGHQLWHLTAPHAGAVPCAMSASANGSGLGAVVFQAKPGSSSPCTIVVAVDTATGKTAWTATLPKAGTSPAASVMVNDTRVVAVNGTEAIGYAATTGKQSWTYQGRGKYCALAGGGSGDTVLLQTTCADTSPKEQAVTVDAGTGKMQWWRGLPSEAASYTVLSASPAVIGVHMSDPAKDTLLALDTKGTVTATIPAAQTGGTLDDTHGAFAPQPALFFQGTTVVTALVPAAQASGGNSSTVVAFDLATGRQLWRTQATEKGQSVPVGTDGTQAVVATEERVGQPARLADYDLTTGQETPGATFPTGTGSLLTASRILYQGAKVVAFPQYTTPYKTAATTWQSQ